MNDLLSKWYVRAAIVGGITYFAYKYAPAGVGKTIALAVGGVSMAGIIGTNVPALGAVMNGYLPVSTASA